MAAAVVLLVATLGVVSLRGAQAGAARTLGVFLVDSVAAAATALTARLVMDIGDLVAGLQTRQFDNVAAGVAQSSAMFLLPGTVALVWLLA